MATKTQKLIPTLLLLAMLATAPLATLAARVALVTDGSTTTPSSEDGGAAKGETKYTFRSGDSLYSVLYPVGKLGGCKGSVCGPLYPCNSGCYCSAPLFGFCGGNCCD